MNNKTRFAIMMFLQYAIWGAWTTALGAHLEKIGFTGTEIAGIYGCMWLVDRQDDESRKSDPFRSNRVSLRRHGVIWLYIWLYMALYGCICAALAWAYNLGCLNCQKSAE